MVTRRDFARFATGTAALASLPISKLFAADGVRFGATTYSLRDLPRIPGEDNISDLIKPLKAAGVTEIDLWSYNAEPAGPNTGPAAPPPPAAYPIKIHTFSKEEIAAAMAQARNLTRDWRMNTPANHFENIRAKFDAAKIAVTSYNVKYDESFTDQEIDITFHQAKVLGASSITVPGTPEVVKRLAMFAEKNEMHIAVSDYTIASALPSKWVKVNLDIGTVVAANASPVAWLQENHDAVAQLTIKDRRRNKGSNEQWGEGDTPINDVLKLVKAKSFKFPVYAEYEYIGLGTPGEELERCMDYMRSAVA